MSLHGAGGTGYAGESNDWDETLKEFGVGKFADWVEEEAKKGGLQTQEEYEAEATTRKLEAASLDELEEMEDDEDEKVLEAYRKKRLAEMKAAAAAIHSGGGRIMEISKSQWISEVSDAAKNNYVLVLLYKPGNDWCSLLERNLLDVARRFPLLKFVKIISTQAIPNFPDSRLPSILVYHKEDPIVQIGIESFGGGSSMNADDVEWALARYNIVKTEMAENPRGEAAGRSKVSFNYVGRSRGE